MNGWTFGSSVDPWLIAVSCDDAIGFIKNGAIILNGNVGIEVILCDVVVPGGGQAKAPPLPVDGEAPGIVVCIMSQ